MAASTRSSNAKATGSALRFAASTSSRSRTASPDEILFGPLAKYVWGRDSATINTFFIGQVGNNVGIDSLEMKVNWRLKHEFGETFALGVEGYSQIDDLSHAGTFDEQKHRLGPVAYFEFEDLPAEWEFAGGTLFGRFGRRRPTSPSSSTPSWNSRRSARR